MTYTYYPFRRGGCQVRPMVLCMCLTTYYHESHCGSYRIQKQCYIVDGDRTSSFGAQAPGLVPRMRNRRADQNFPIFEAIMVVQRGAIGLKSLLVFHHRTRIDDRSFTVRVYSGQYSVHSVPQYNNASLCRETVENSRTHLKVCTNYLTYDFQMG